MREQSHGIQERAVSARRPAQVPEKVRSSGSTALNFPIHSTVKAGCIVTSDSL